MRISDWSSDVCSSDLAGFVRYLPLGALVAIILPAELVFALGAWSAGGVDLAARAAPVVSDKSNIQQIGELPYTRYFFLFEAAGIILFVAMIGASLLPLFLPVGVGL